MAPGSTLMPTAIVNPSNHTVTGSVEWSKVSGSDSITINSATGEVTVSGSAVDGDIATICATFGSKSGECVIKVSSIQYGVTVINGSTSVGSKTTEGTKVDLKANAAPAGQVFDKWVATTGEEYGEVDFADASMAETYFSMPNKHVVVTATYKDKPVIPDGGDSGSGDSGSGSGSSGSSSRRPS